MPIQVEWFDDSKQIVLWKVEAHWALNEMHDAYTRGTQLCAEVPENEVNAIIDMTAVKSVPTNIFGALFTRSQTLAPNFHMAVVVSNSTLVKGVASVLTSMAVLRQRFVVVKSIDEALEFIRKLHKQDELSLT